MINRKLGLFWFECLKDVFLIMNEVNLLFERKYLIEIGDRKSIWINSGKCLLKLVKYKIIDLRILVNV